MHPLAAAPRFCPRPGVLRRSFAALLGVLLLFGCVEPLAADVHDGDAPGAEVAAAAAFLGHTLAGAPERVVVPDAAVFAAGAPDGRATAGPTRDGQRAGTPQGGAPTHAFHVCHCTHAHGGMLTERFVLTAAERVVAAPVRARSDRLPPSPAPEHPLRPPVLPHTA